jgi:glutamyl-tRNA reductase
VDAAHPASDGNDDMPSLAALREDIIDADVLISSIRPRECFLSCSAMKAIMAMRENRTTLLFDLSSPHSIDPRVHNIDHVYLFDLGDLQRAAESHMCERQREARRAARAHR